MRPAYPFDEGATARAVVDEQQDVRHLFSRFSSFGLDQPGLYAFLKLPGGGILDPSHPANDDLSHRATLPRFFLRCTDTPF